jgi:hypothetical protein
MKLRDLICKLSELESLYGPDIEVYAFDFEFDHNKVGDLIVSFDKEAKPSLLTITS